MKKTIAITYILSATAYAGSGVGGGTPPALQDLEQTLNVSPELDGGLYDLKGDLGLLTKIKLQPQMFVSGGSSGGGTPSLELDGGMGGSNRSIANLGGTGGGSTPPLLRFSPEDIARLRDRTKPLNAVNLEGGNSSYNIEAGNTLKTLILNDRREVMRSAVQ